MIGRLSECARLIAEVKERKRSRISNANILENGEAQDPSSSSRIGLESWIPLVIAGSNGSVSVDTGHIS